MSTDIDRIERGLRYVHEIWANTLEVLLAAWLLQGQFTSIMSTSSSLTVSSPSLPSPTPVLLLLSGPFLLILLSALFTTLITHLAAPRIQSWAHHTAARVRLTNALIASLKPLKIAGLETYAESALLRARNGEMRAGTAYRWLTVASFFNAFVPEYGAPVLTFGVLMMMMRMRMGTEMVGATDMPLGRVFAIVAYLRLMTAPLSQLLQRVPAMGSAMVSLRRVEEFLTTGAQPRGEYRVFVQDDHEEEEGLLGLGDADVSEDAAAAAADTHINTNAAITLQKVHVGWSQTTWALHDLTLSIPRSKVTIVTGPVAAGKSTLCKALLGEAAFVQGTITFHNQQQQQDPPVIGYTAQSPFLTNGTIQSNIINFAPFHPALYNEVLETVLLKEDLASGLLPLGDATPLGSNGVTTLSGGQKQRVALARALYFCSSAAANSSLCVLDDFTAGLDTQTADEIVRRLLSNEAGFLARRCPGATVVWATHALRYLSLAQCVIALSGDGRLLRCGGPEDLLKDAQVALGLSDDDQEEKNEDNQADDNEVRQGNRMEAKKDGAQDPSRALTEASVYTYYLSSFRVTLLAAAILAGLVCGVTSNAGVLWLKAWTENSSSDSSPPQQQNVNTFYLAMYAMINTAAVASLGLYGALTMVSMARTSGTALHRRAADALIHAPLRFLSTADAGALVTYFSQDINLVDTVLPHMVMNTFLAGCLFAGQFVIVAIGTPLVAVSYPVILGLLCLLAAYYLRASRQLRLLELENKAPLYAHFADTVRGIVSVRAFGWAREYMALNHRYLDDSLRPLYLLQVMGVWLGLVLKLIVAIMAVAVTVLATQVEVGTAKEPSGGRAGFVGAGLLALMSSDEMLNAIVQCWVQLEMSLGAIKRLKEFGEQAGREDLAGEDMKPNEQWPQKGDIVLDSVNASYSQERYKDSAEEEEEEEVDFALRNVSFTIPAGQKVAVVGRTGSGKSSLILLLLRLLDPTGETANNMTIDGLQLRRIDRGILRQRVIAIPQDVAFLAAGETFRTALDPYMRATDAECVAALDAVGLRGVIENIGGLGAEMSKAALSQGQQQLFSVAIAVLRARFREKAGCTGGVLLLDEVTANVDRATEKVIMEAIDRVFVKYTAIAVTHNLESVRDFDRVMVMAGGRVVREGSPEMQNTIRNS
ncbi:P-loop containing nucleoside triphosphate hydrolase protein [Coniella lustricola]|uniref:P-loop containing nucleoside triphosphate hydrolase protein n=1 Tax=Coniella lustricola TaxID=2025994 RepID=A0A2T2ZW74_9PEZI|nr:P-loop containing nucleoside triphosphate hydrolase protein [Coniella lustricola]